MVCKRVKAATFWLFREEAAQRRSLVHSSSRYVLTMMYDAAGHMNKVGKTKVLKLTRKVDDVSFVGCSFDRANDACGLLMRIQTCNHQNVAEVRTYCVRRGPLLCREKERYIPPTCEKRLSSIILTHMHISEGIESERVYLWIKA